MRKKTKIIGTLIAFLVLGLLIYRSPDESYPKENLSAAIEAGREYAWNIFYGNKQELLKGSIEPAKRKVINSNLREIADSEIDEHLEEFHLDRKTLLETKQFGKYGIVSPMFEEKSTMDLLILERMNGFVVMTFGYKDLDGIVKIAEKGKMLFSVAVRYYQPIDSRFFYRISRKIMNLPLLREVTGEYGSTGRWLIFDYNYKYNRNDYFLWVFKEGENLSQQNIKKLEEFNNILKNKESWEKWNKELTETTDKGLSFLYEWGIMSVKDQLNRIENLFGKYSEATKTD